MDCSPIIPAVRAAVHHLHRPVHHVWHHVHHAVTKHVAPVAKAVVAQACSKSTLLPLIVGGGLLAGAVPPAPFGPFGPLGEDGAPLFGPGENWSPQTLSGGPESPQQPQVFGGNPGGGGSGSGGVGPWDGFPAFPTVEPPELGPTGPGPTDPGPTNPGPTGPGRPGHFPHPHVPLTPLDPTVVSSVTEPASLGVLGVGVAALLWSRRRRFGLQQSGPGQTERRPDRAEEAL